MVVKIDNIIVLKKNDVFHINYCNRNLTQHTKKNPLKCREKRDLVFCAIDFSYNCC